MVRRSAAGVAMAGALLLLVGCATTNAGGPGAGNPVASPNPSTNAPELPGDENPDEVPADTAWLVTATTSKFTASTRLCPGDGLMAVPMDPEFTGIFAEMNGGPPDSWNPNEMYQVDQGVLLDLGARQYSYTFDVGGITGDHWEVSRAKLTIVTDEAGRPRSGTGTGKLRVVYSTGDIAYSTDTTTFTIEPADPAPWCFL